MAFEIVDGATGAPHISSEDLACMNESVLGVKNCVFPWGSQFAATVESANSLTIASGSGMVGAKRFWNKSNVALTIENGSQNQRRNDLVVARYSKTSGGRESVEPIVLKGTPTTGDPSDPAIGEGDLKLWRIPIDGITVGTPVKLFSAYSLPMALGGTGSTTAAGALTNLGAAQAKILAGPKIENYMIEGQTVMLSELVSQQVHGIVLCWCAYEYGESKPYDNFYMFVPKSHVATKEGEGVLTSMTTGGYGQVGTKYVYISDNRISGSNVNVEHGTRNGVTFDNRHWVLDTVVGV